MEKLTVWVEPGTSFVSDDAPTGDLRQEAQADSIRASLVAAARKAGVWMGMVWGGGSVEPLPHAWSRCCAAAEGGAALVYGDYEGRAGRVDTLDPEPGSLREEFDAGPVWLARSAAVLAAIESLPAAVVSPRAVRYGLRLGLLRQGAMRLPEEIARTVRDVPEDLFGYVRAGTESLQRELETVLTDHLRRVDAWLPPRERRFIDHAVYPVDASVVISVRDRVRTIGDAVSSALSQETDFPFNVLMVDNHSRDDTARKAMEASAGDARLQIIVPGRTDLGIGGCWNVAAFSSRAGRFLVQLDSDDVYASHESLQAMIGLIRSGPWAMAVGAYRTVDMQRVEIPPGLVAHHEWTAENGHNNLLRVSGIGAPRVFATGVVREHPFPNVSYGEDYAVALRVSRDYHIARSFDPVYLARRWEGNTDHLPSAELNRRREAYKNRLRTVEVGARARTRDG